jgi:ATP-dependent exoDNAse (exonuclease V) beta subunit
VVRSLVELSSGKPSDLRQQLEEELPGRPLTDRAETVLTLILHDYPNFSVSTIDSFFQKLLRALAREIQLPLRAEVQIHQEDAILEVSDRLLDKAGEDKELSRWLEKLVLKKLDEDRGWDLRKDVQWITAEMLEEGGSRPAMDRPELNAFIEELKEKRNSFEADMKRIGKAALDEIERAGYSEDDFTRGNQGPAGYLARITDARSGKGYTMNSYVRKALESPDNWVRKADLKDKPKMAFIEDNLFPKLQEAKSLMDLEHGKYLTAIELLKTLYLFGIINDLTGIFAEYRRERNQILISDTPKLLQGILTGDDTPFVYEKTGNRYKHLLIDEFQDTSELQWKNLLPLVINSLGSGFMTLIVGDAKQSIYRWRGGEARLLLSGIKEHLKAFQDLLLPKSLDTNYRSKKEIVQFNNRLFSEIPDMLESTGSLQDLDLLREAYGSDLEQKVAEKNNSGGYVEWLSFTNEKKSGEETVDEIEHNDPDADGISGPWKDKSLARMLETVNDLLSRGFRHRDIAILVRTNNEGNAAAQHLFTNGIDKIITPDSLAISGSPKVRFLINAFRLLSDPRNNIARSQMLHFYTETNGHGAMTMHDVFRQEQKKRKKNDPPGNRQLFGNESTVDRPFNKTLPAEFVDAIETLAKLPVYEISEQLVRIFGLNNPPDAYIQRFQDLVLEYNTRHHAGVAGFVSWWDENEKVQNSSVVIPENEDAIRIMSIHKSKGLQFPAVIMPFVEWKLEPKSGQLIWVSTDIPPFDRLGRTGVYSGKALEETVFNPDWQEERSLNVVDNVNLLYVAFTRAEEELYLFGPADSGKGALNTTSRLVYRTLTQAGSTAGEDGCIIFGEKTLSRPAGRTEGQTAQLPSYPVNRWQDRIRIATRARRLSDLLQEKDDSGKRYGILVHDVLARIRTEADIDREVDRCFFEGELTSSQADELKSLIREVTSHPTLSGFFDSGWDVRREQEIITPEGDLLRPDRVLIRKKEAVVIDFKTGKPEEKHHLQLQQYGKLLEKMGYTGIKRYIVYLNDFAVKEVAG